MGQLILLRHGESTWNKKNLFTGWVDIPLSKAGVEESQCAGKALADLPIDIIYTSTLIRAIMTAMLVMNEHNSGRVPAILHPREGKMEHWGHCHDDKCRRELIPTIRAWQLNERMYGELQGMNKEEMRKKFGKDQVQLWRRSFDIPPPGGESLEMTAARAVPYFEQEIVPQLKEGKNVLIAAHGNSLRSIVMRLDNLSKEEVLKLELKTGKPYIYDYQDGHYTQETPS